MPEYIWQLAASGYYGRSVHASILRTAPVSVQRAPCLQCVQYHS